MALQPIPPPEPIPIDLLGRIQTEAMKRQYLGALADREARSLITRSYNTTKEEAAAVDRVVGAPQTLYTSAGDFVRHAVFELLMAYEEAGFPDTYVRDVAAHIRAMRETAERLRLRQDFAEVLSVYETSLLDGVDVGDWDLVQDTLETLEGYVERTPDQYWRAHLKRTTLKSVIVKGAIDALYEYARNDEQYANRAARWQAWLEGLTE